MATQLGELQKLYAVEKEFLIPRKPKDGEVQAKIMIMDLSLDEMKEFDIDPDAPLKETVDQIYGLMSKCMGIGIDAIKKISVRYLNDIMDIVMEVNNLSGALDDSKISKVKDFMAQRKAKPKDESEGQNPGQDISK